MVCSLITSKYDIYNKVTSMGHFPLCLYGNGKLFGGLFQSTLNYFDI